MAASIQLCAEDVADYFQDMEDPRSEINRRHPLPSVIAISLMAVLAGASGPTAIAAWASDKQEFLRQALPLPNGVPRKDVYRRVLQMLNPQAFQLCFTDWLMSLRKPRQQNWWARSCSGRRASS